MSEISDRMLRSTHRGVHEQFNMLVVAMYIQEEASSGAFESQLSRASRKEIKGWVKEKAVAKFREMGYSPGFLQRRLLVYVFELYEWFYNQYTTCFVFKPEVSLSDIQYTILLLASEAMDQQFEREGLADICGFLKQDIAQIKENVRR